MPTDSDRFNQDFPTPLQRAILRAVIDGFMQARGLARTFRPERIKDTTILRRLCVEERLGDLIFDMSKYRSVYRQTTSCSNWVMESDHIVLTAVSRSSRVDQLPVEPYRKILASEKVLPLFGEKPICASGRTYAVLLYGGRPGASLPEFVDIVFPDKNGHLGSESINLAARFLHVLTSLHDHDPYVEIAVPLSVDGPSVSTGAPEVEVKVTLRKRPDQEGGDAG